MVRRIATSAIALDWAPILLVPPVLIIDAALSSYGKPITPISVLAAFVGCLPLAARRHVSFTVLAGPLVAGIVLTLWLLHPADTVVLIPMIALFELALGGDRRRSLLMGVAVLPCVVVSILPFSSGFSQTASLVIRNLILCLLAIVGGDLLRTRRVSTQRLVQAAEQEALRRVGEERLQIAREIHDLVAHAMTAINVQAGVAAHLLERDPGQAHDALRNIKDTSGLALSDLRSTLEVLRDPSQGVPLGPPDGLSDLKALTDGLSSGGVSVALELDDTRDLPAAIQSAAYRIVQEALTNVARHAAATSACVRVRRTAGAVSIEVTDDGRTAAADATAPARVGNGLRGMRERAMALGGTLETGTIDPRGWRVLARLPLGQAGANGSAEP